MANLKTLVERKLDQIELDERNLEQGKIWAYSSAAEYTNFVGGFCWIACEAGRILLETWGAGGSGARMCCCGQSIPIAV
jgi:hypothetical protein